jgi:phytoene synthase
MTALASERPAAAECTPAAIAAGSGSNFLAGFVCLDAERRAAMTALYAFCRVADDAVDETPDAATGERHLAFWRAELVAASAGQALTPVGRAVQAAMQRFGVRQAPLDELLLGMAMDLRPQPFADADELRRYCHRVASAVGLACLPVFGADSDGARVYAEALGQALQHTNILRDLREDARVGRCYVPTSWMTACGVDAAWLGGDGPAAVYAANGPLARLCQRLQDVARAEFAAAANALAALPRRERRALVPARIMGAVYATLLVRLAARGGDLRQPRVRVGKAHKLWLAFATWLGVRA